jgi:hypothetical protein
VIDPLNLIAAIGIGVVIFGLCLWAAWDMNNVPPPLHEQRDRRR